MDDLERRINLLSSVTLRQELRKALLKNRSLEQQAAFMTITVVALLSERDDKTITVDPVGVSQGTSHLRLSMETIPNLINPGAPPRMRWVLSAPEEEKVGDQAAHV